MSDLQRGTCRRIAIEEAFCTAAVLTALREWAAAAGADEADQDLLSFLFDQELPGPRRVRRQLLDLEDERLAVMDSGGVDVQLLSLTAPGVQALADGPATALTARVNDQLAEVIARHPRRFAGLAAIAPQDPRSAAREIERAVHELNLNGVVINSHIRGESVDGERYWPIFETAQGLGVPVYIHPGSPSALLAPACTSYGRKSGIYGFQAEIGLHGIRLICSGALDRFPDLRIVLGHLGEGIPFWLWRVDDTRPANGSRGSRPALELTPGEYVKRNFMITTSGVNCHPALRFCIDEVGADNIMWATDYPFQRTEGAVEFMRSAPISDDDKHKIFHRNAERVFGIAPLAAAVGGG